MCAYQTSEDVREVTDEDDPVEEREESAVVCFSVVFVTKRAIYSTQSKWCLEMTRVSYQR